MPATPLVSVLVTVHDHEAYLRAALDSILASSFEDFELIVVDDASTDGSAEIAREVVTFDDRTRFETNRRNLGQIANRNKAASLAVGRYLKYVDSDDLIYPHGLEVMVESMERYPDAAAALAHSMPDDDSPYPWHLEPEEAYQKHFLGRGCMSCGPTGAIIRRDAFESVGGFREDWGILADIDLWYRLASANPIVLLPPGLVWWRRHEEQSFTKDDAADFYLRRDCELDMATLEQSCPLSGPDLRRARTRRRRQLARRVLSVGLRRRQPARSWRLFRDSGLSLSDLARGFLRSP